MFWPQLAVYLLLHIEIYGVVGLAKWSLPRLNRNQDRGSHLNLDIACAMRDVGVQHPWYSLEFCGQAVRQTATELGSTFICALNVVKQPLQAHCCLRLE